MSYPHLHHPLLIEDVLHQIFAYLDSYDDVASCYDVCPVWRRLVPRYIDLVRPPVLVGKEMPLTYTQTLQYLLSVGPEGNPALKSSRFVFIDANPDTTVMQRLLAEHGTRIKQLEVYYGVYDMKGPEWPELSVGQFERLLTQGTPNLETLILTLMPTKVLQAASVLATVDSASKPLSLKYIQFLLYHLADEGRVGYSTGFLRGLYSACPKLDAVSIAGVARMNVEGHGHNENSHSLGYEIVEALMCTGRFQQVKKLHVTWAGHDLIELLANAEERAAEVGRTKTPKTIAQLEHLTIEHVQYCCPILGPLLRGNLLRTMGTRLKFLSLPDDRTRNVSMGFVGGDLEHLQITKSYHAQHNESEPDDWIGGVQEEDDGPLQYATQFPRLRSLAFQGHLSNYRAEEIFPDGLAASFVPAPSVRVLGAIPFGIDLMWRITRQFPSLTIIRTPIPFGYEDLLISVWEGCPNLTELFLAFGSDQDEPNLNGAGVGGNAGRVPPLQSLDSIFSGIPEHECEAHRASQAAEEFERTWSTLKARTPSVCDLKGIRKLVIEECQPITTEDREDTISKPRLDRLTDVCAHAAFARMSKEIVFLEVAAKLHNISAPFVSHICNQAGLTKVKLDSSNAATLHPLRLIKPRLGYEVIGTKLPPNWVGVEQFPWTGCASAVPLDDVFRFIKLSALSSAGAQAGKSTNPATRDNGNETETRTMPTKTQTNEDERSSQRQPWRLRKTINKTISKFCAFF